MTLFGLGFKKMVHGKVFIISQDTSKQKNLPQKGLTEESLMKGLLIEAWIKLMQPTGVSEFPMD